MVRLFCLTLAITALVLTSMPSANAAQQDTIIYGKDYDSFRINQGGWPDCERVCERDRRCRAWLFIKRDRSCRLKSDAGPTRQSSCCVAGVKQRYQPPRPNNITGKITTIDLTSSLENLGICVQTAPNIPKRFDNWACVRKDNRLYSEITELLMSAYRYGDECLISWERGQRGQDRRGLPAEIASLRCTPAN